MEEACSSESDFDVGTFSWNFFWYGTESLYCDVVLTSAGRWFSPANTPSCGCKRNVMLSNLKFDPSIGIQVNYSFLAILDYGETWSVLVCYIRTIFLTSKTICLRIEKLEECHCARRCDRAVRWGWWRICLSAVYVKTRWDSEHEMCINIFHQCNAFFTLQIVYIEYGLQS